MNVLSPQMSTWAGDAPVIIWENSQGRTFLFYTDWQKPRLSWSDNAFAKSSESTKLSRQKAQNILATWVVLSSVTLQRVRL